MLDSTNPLLDDRDVDFLLHDVLAAERLTQLPAFAEHSRATFDLYLQTTRRLAREVLFPTYRPMDSAPPVLEAGRVHVHPLMHNLYPRLVELGSITATRPPEMGGQSLPLTIHTAALAYLLAANLSAAIYVPLAAASAGLIEAFGSADLQETYMRPMYAGAWTGTLAITEPQAGSDLGDVKSSATLTPAGHFLLRGQKIFISGGDHDITENIVHIVLARIDGAPPGMMGLSLFVVPRLRPEAGRLVPNDVETTGLIHKLGWRGLPSAILSFGEAGDCRGWLLGQPHHGLLYLLQTLSDSRLLFGTAAAATASVAYHEAVKHARERQQGRPLTAPDPTTPPVAIIEHADVRRMLLRQKAIVDGASCLVLHTSRYADIAAHGASAEERQRARLLFDLLAPVAKSFPTDKGFEANALAIQVLGSYGGSSEHLPEAWLRDQKLNSLHAGTPGLLAMDLLGRQALSAEGAALRALGEDIASGVARARAAGVETPLCEAVERAAADVAQLTLELGALGQAGQPERMLLHSADYLELFSLLVVGWQWLVQAAAARERLSTGHDDPGFLQGKLCAAQYFIATELPRIAHLCALCRSGEGSYERMKPEWF